jgi:hypothetical protein
MERIIGSLAWLAGAGAALGAATRFGVAGANAWFEGSRADSAIILLDYNSLSCLLNRHA